MTAPLLPEMPIPLAAQIACVEREIGMRERVYPRWVSERRLTQAKADAELDAMRAVLATLKDGVDVRARLDGDARLGAVLMRYIDRLADTTPEDSAEKIAAELVAAADAVLNGTSPPDGEGPGVVNIHRLAAETWEAKYWAMRERTEKAEGLLDCKMKRTVTVHPASIIYSGCSVHVLIEAVLREPDAMPPEPDRPGAVCW